MDRMNSNGLKGRGVFQDFINPLIKKIYGRGRGIVHEGVLEESNRANEKEFQGGSLATTADRRAGRESETETQATGGLTEGEINFLKAATGYSREEIIRLFGGNGTSFREVVQGQDNNEVERSKNMVDGLAEKFNTPVTIVENVDELPQNRRNKKGWFNPKTGEVVVVLPNHVSEEDVVQTVLCLQCGVELRLPLNKSNRKVAFIVYVYYHKKKDWEIKFLNPFFVCYTMNSLISQLPINVTSRWVQP